MIQVKCVCLEQHAKFGKGGHQQYCNRKRKTSCQLHRSQNLAYWVMKSSPATLQGEKKKKKKKKSNIKTDMQIGIGPKGQDVNMIRPKVTEMLFIHILISLKSWLRCYAFSESFSFSSENNSFLNPFLLLLSLAKLYFYLRNLIIIGLYHQNKISIKIGTLHLAYYTITDIWNSLGTQ